MENRFKAIGETFEALKVKFQSGAISRQQFIDEMKKLRVKDEDGRYWMIGAQTGKWYYFDGRDWVQTDPPSQREKKSICVYCGFENKIEADVCVRCGGTMSEGGEPVDRCPNCGSVLEKPLLTCPRCSPKPGELAHVEIVRLGAAADIRGETYILRSVRLPSALLFGGVLGLLAGVVFGAVAGAVGSLNDLLNFLPAALLEIQGKLMGALFDALLGAAAGFGAGAAAGAVIGWLVNFVLSIIGGLKCRVSNPSAASIEEAMTREKPKSRPRDSQTGPSGFSLRD